MFISYHLGKMLNPNFLYKHYYLLGNQLAIFQQIQRLMCTQDEYSSDFHMDIFDFKDGPFATKLIYFILSEKH